MALQCPHCPLRFDLKPMLADHLQVDHGIGPEVTDPLQPESKRIGLVRPDELDGDDEHGGDAEHRGDHR